MNAKKSILLTLLPIVICSCGKEKTKLVKSEVTYEDGQIAFKTEYEYDKKGNVSKKRNYSYDETGKECFEYLDTYTYNDNNDMLTYSCTDYDENGNGTLAEKSIFTYDANYNCVKSEYFDVVDGNDILIYRLEEIYDSNNNVISSASYTQKDGTTELYLFEDETFEYYAGTNNVSIIRTNSYDEDGTKHENTDVMTFVYDKNGNCVIEKLTSQDFGVSLIAYGYDTNGYRISESFFFDDGEGNLVLDNTTAYSYDDNGNILSSVITTTNASGDVKILKTEYSYDKNSNLTKEEKSLYNTTLQQFEVYEYTIYNY